MQENSLYDKKSLREIYGAKNVDWNEVAKDCVAFSNAQGGHIHYGIEDKDNMPPIGQIIPTDLITTLLNKIHSKTENVNVAAEIVTAQNGGQYIDLHVLRGHSVASTSSGKFFMRISDNSEPITGEEIKRLTEEKGYFRWEDQPTKWKYTDADNDKLNAFISKIRNSDKVSNFVKEKEIVEILNHYFLIEEDTGLMTNLGVLFIGKQSQRGRLINPLVVQCIKYDALGNKVQKYVWDDFSLSPDEIIEDVWNRIPDWKESYEINDGLFRREIPAYDKAVIRELMSNAIVHRAYSVKGDIFINIYPNRIEVVNPGLLPLSVTPQNILHKTVKRNEHFAAIFAALGLMEREGSGYDKIYELQLLNGKPLPEVIETDDAVKVIVERQIIRKEAIKITQTIINDYQLTQKQIICLGLIAQHERISATKLIDILNLKNRNELSPWLDQLLTYQIVVPIGKHRSTEYQVKNEVLRLSDYKGKTSLKRVEQYRIKELILEDLKIYQCATLKDIRQRIGDEIDSIKVKKQLNVLIEENKVEPVGQRRWTKYRLKTNS